MPHKKKYNVQQVIKLVQSEDVHMVGILLEPPDSESGDNADSDSGDEEIGTMDIIMKTVLYVIVLPLPIVKHGNRENFPRQGGQQMNF